METWVDYNGSHWVIRAMATSHLQNAIKAIERMVASRFADHVAGYLDDGFQSVSADPKIARWVSSRTAMQRELARRYAAESYAAAGTFSAIRINGVAIRVDSNELVVAGHTLSFSQAQQLGQYLLAITKEGASDEYNPKN